ncbi:SusC/RagA family TonB-linked outer membrane protein [Phocaeicola plebeius]|uniref:SusC/RagA family TonB-linked outer membrane protein n=1 Tax=Phocaeicola plebeius TaxID=310297 RepID=UPI00294358F3|nr:SusC/RagA family TonB-linked outer membrane protein [Phocaeicola plebeius]
MRIGRFSQMFLLLVVSGWGTVWAAPEKSVDASILQQSAKITTQGTVIDAQGEPLIGVSILEVGTTNGTITDIDGKFTLQVTSGATLELSYIGYKTQQLKAVSDLGTIQMSDDTEVLQEVVVTALGIKREKKALGYAMQEVKGESLVEARETNLANALSGKISGVQIIRSSNGPGGSSKIQLRGANSVTGTNQPLIVVDGVPMDNFTGASNNDIDNPSMDMGNGLSDINPEDIESMSVLKGASAAALYGSRAGNGVILITTKKGKENPGLGVTISASVSAETLFMLPKRQTSFGQGENGVYDATNGNSWGPAITGQEYTKWDGSTGIMQAYDNVKNYFDTGINFTESISFSQMFGKTAIYTSLNRMDDASKIPGSELHRTNLTLRASSSFGKDDRWSVDAKVQYINSLANNRPQGGSRDANAFYTVFNLPTTIDIRDFSSPLNDEYGNMTWWNRSGVNPYWLKEYNPNKDSRNRFLMNGSLKYKITEWLDAEIRAGSDMYFTERDDKLYAGSTINDGDSRYTMGEQKFYENNFSFLISGHKDHIFGNWGGNFSFGGNLMERKSTGVEVSMGKLTAPDLFSLNNGPKDQLGITEFYSHKKINSLYGTLGINYDGWAFLDATFRNDWSSALSKKNRSFFYPSVSVSWVISDMVNKIGKTMPEWFTYAKVRASFAQVGNDMDPYQLYDTYTISSIGGQPTADQGKIKYDADVRSELITSWEVGTELKFFNNRFGIDFAWYKTNAKRQLMNIPMNNLSGYESMKINAGNIQNTGIELMLNARPVETKDFSWDTQLNISRNKSKIIELLPGQPGMRYSLGGSDALQIYAVAGGVYGEIWGTKYQRVEDVNSPYYGQLLLSDSGLPQATSERYKIGEQQPDMMAGWTNSFTYKNFGFSFLIDGRFGGDIFSFTNLELQSSGIAEVTAPGGKRDDIVVPGVIRQSDGSYAQNQTPVSLQKYYQALGTGRAGISEAYIYDATNIRLRNVSLTYSFPSSLLKKTPIQRLKLGVSVNNVWMIKSNLNGIDPESVYATSTNATGMENASAPTSRTYLFNVTLGF